MKVNVGIADIWYWSFSIGEVKIPWSKTLESFSMGITKACKKQFSATNLNDSHDNDQLQFVFVVSICLTFIPLTNSITISCYYSWDWIIRDDVIWLLTFAIDSSFYSITRHGYWLLTSNLAGVPRIFTDRENAEIASLDLQFSHEDDHFFLEYIRNSRININIRQVFWVYSSTMY